MQKYPRSIVRPIERANCNFWFEYRDGVHTCNIKDIDTGELVLAVAGADELDALSKASPLVANRPKKLTDHELRRKLAESERRAAELEAKLVDSQLAEEAKRNRGRGKKEDTTPADVPVSEA